MRLRPGSTKAMSKVDNASTLMGTTEGEWVVTAAGNGLRATGERWAAWDASNEAFRSVQFAALPSKRSKLQEDPMEISLWLNDGEETGSEGKKGGDLRNTSTTHLAAQDTSCSRSPRYDMHKCCTIVLPRNLLLLTPTCDDRRVLRVRSGVIFASRRPCERTTCCRMQHCEEGEGRICTARRMLKHAWAYEHGRPRVIV